MSASLYWSLPVNKQCVNTSPTARDALVKVFGDSIEMNDYSRLEAMYEASKDESYKAVMELVLRYEQIKIGIEY